MASSNWTLLAILAWIVLHAEGGAAAAPVVCPVPLGNTCQDSDRCRPYKDTEALRCVQCKEGFSRRPSDGSCVQCPLDGCGICNTPDQCGTCANSQMLLSNGTCATAGCPAGCHSCETTADGDCKCWPCGKRVRVSLADTINSVAARCGISPAQIRNHPGNAALNEGNRKVENTNEPLGNFHVIKLPPRPCQEEGIASIESQCPPNTFWLSCAGSVACPNIADLMTGNNVTYGCVEEQVCLDLYDECLRMMPECPSCCFSKKCNGIPTENMSGQPERWYFMTFEDGSAHCDPFLRAAGRR